MRAVNAMVIDFKPAGEPGTRAEFTYHTTPATISITGKDLDAVCADANQKHVMSDHDKNLFIEQHKDGFAILRGGVKEPLAVGPTQDAAIEKARKLAPMPPFMWSAFGTSKAAAAINGGGSDRRQAAPGSPAGPRPGRLRCYGRFLRRRLALLALGFVFDQFFHVLGVSVVIFGRIEFCRHALDQLQGKIDFVGDQFSLTGRRSSFTGRFLRRSGAY
jgi:hypothetical protein